MESIDSKKIGLLLGPTLFLLTLQFFHPEGMSKEANAILASTLWIAVWWITEAIPIAVTSLLPIILFPLTGGLSLSDTTASFGHKYVFLYIGGFILAIAIERWNLHKRIALNIINFIGTNIKSIILGFMVATAFLSMWISNTATSVMMLPIGMAIVAQLRDNPNTNENENLIFGKALMLGIAYSASIGGMATLIGTPPNLVLAGIVQEMYGIEITFSKWIVFGLPISISLLFLCWKYLTTFAFKFTQTSFPGGKAEIKRQLQKLGRISYEEKTVLVVFVATAIAWIGRSPLQNFIQSTYSDADIELYQNTALAQIDDTIIAIIAGIVLFLLPASKDKKRTILTWEEAVKLPWGILLLFGGGLALAEGFKSSGLALWIGNQMTLLEHVPLFLLLLVLVAAVNFLTEITSNLATTAMILPVLASMAVIIGVHPYILMVGATVAASCAFMLPVATPPNAVVFGSGYLTIPDMVRAGIWMNVLSIILLTIITYFILPYLWDFNPSSFPLEWMTK
ncbi:MAG: DASS family sodium-coupled anion symporter [Chitinophagales bacterium]